MYLLVWIRIPVIPLLFTWEIEMQLLTAHEAGEIAWLWNDHWKEALCQWICSRSVSKFHLHCSRCLIDKDQSETQLPPSSKLRVQNVIRWFQIIAHLWAHAFQRSCAHLDFLISYTGGANRYLNFISYITKPCSFMILHKSFPYRKYFAELETILSTGNT